MPADKRLPEELDELSPDDKIIQEAKDRFKRGLEWENEFRKLYLADVKFANGDSDNGWQWPTDTKRDRDLSARPCLTINKVQTIVLAITNDIRKNPPSVKIKPTGGDGTFEAAQTWEGLFRNIQYESNATVIYVNAAESQVEGGIGYWRVMHDFVDEKSHDQSIKIVPVADQLGVLLDCDIKEKNGSDAKWGFVYEDINKDEFKRDHPDIDLPSSDVFALSEADSWITTDKVRIAEYYRIREKKDELITLETPDGQSETFYKSDIPAKWQKLYKQAKDEKSNLVKTRTVKRKVLEWFKIGGTQIIDRRDETDDNEPLKGNYIPIIRCPGREKRIDGKLERKGLVRTLKDPQRMWNYNSSGQVEFGALQTKTPWILPAAAIEGNQGAWATANTTNAAYLTWKHIDSRGQPIPKPERNDPPGTSPAFLEGMKIAGAEMEMASGRQQGQQQNPEIERTPRAIDERVHAGETATYDFNDNLAMAVAYTATVILDLAPHIYDTERLEKILDPDGTQREVTISPDAEKPYEEKKNGDNVEVLFNPTIGRYGVQADVGPAYSTQLEESWNAFTGIFIKQPELINIFGDIAFRNSPFPAALAVAERLKRNIRANAPWLLDDDTMTPKIQELTKQVQDGEQKISELLQKLAEKNLEIKGKAEMRDIDTYEAQSHRITAESNAVVDLINTPLGEALLRAIAETLAEAGHTDLKDVTDANKSILENKGDNGVGVGAGGTGGD